jgi:hypothetical protein
MERLHIGGPLHGQRLLRPGQVGHTGVGPRWAIWEGGPGRLVPSKVDGAPGAPERRAPAELPDRFHHVEVDGPSGGRGDPSVRRAEISEARRGAGRYGPPTPGPAA